MDHRQQVYHICRVQDLPEGVSEKMRAVVRAANGHRPVYHLPIAIAIVGGGSLSVLFLRGDVRNLIPMVIAVAILLALFTLPFSRGRARRAASFCLDAGVCAACGYLVAGTEAQLDGYVICPECGAAWLSGNSPEPAARAQ